MLERDLAHNKFSVNDALYELDRAIKDGKDLIKVIVGYGSNNGSHKIKIAVIKALDEYLNKKQIKGYLLGEDVDIFNPKYQNFKLRNLIPDKDKIINKGVIYIHKR